MYIRMFVHTHVRELWCVRVYVDMFVHMYLLLVCTCASVRVYGVYMYNHMFVCKFVCICVRMYVCICRYGINSLCAY